jgi:hypothetical protein
MSTTEAQLKKRIPFPRDFDSRDSWHIYLIGAWLASKRAEHKTLTKSFAIALADMLASPVARPAIVSYAKDKSCPFGWDGSKISVYDVLCLYETPDTDGCAFVAPSFAVAHPNLADAIAAAANGDMQKAEDAIERAADSGELNPEHQIE